LAKLLVERLGEKKARKVYQALGKLLGVKQKA
jgi:hypothetical protein